MLYCDVQLTGVTLWNMLFCGILRSFGLLYVEMLDVFDARPRIASWVPGTFAISVTLIGKKPQG